MTVIKQKGKSIFDYEVDLIVNPVNCRGVSGKGLAKKFKEKYPEEQVVYEQQCKTGALDVGVVSFVYTHKEFPKFICYFPTKREWKNPSKIEYIERGLQNFLKLLTYHHSEVESIAMPALGCGCGGLDFELISPLIHYYFHSLQDLTVYLIEPYEYK